MDFFIYKPMGIAVKFFYDLFGGNFGLSIFVFTLLINLVLIPLNIRSQSTQMKSARIKPKIDALKEKYGDDRRKLQEAQMELQKREGVSMTGGCLTMVIRLPFLWGIYNAVTNPLSHILRLDSDVITKAKEALMGVLGKDAAAKVSELNVVQNAAQLPESMTSLSQRISTELNFNLFGLNLTEQPLFSMNILKSFSWIWLIPILSFATAMLSSVISLQLQKRYNPDTPRMGGMMLTMPVVSLIIGFTVPGAVGFYWLCSNIVGAGVQSFVQVRYNPNKLIAKAELKEMRKRQKTEADKMAAVLVADAAAAE